MTKTYEKEIKIVGIILFFKLIILSLIPLTGDEAYFIKWATHLSSGYYDHPPMVGWLIYLMSYISDNIIFFRLFSFFAAITVAFSIYNIAKLYIDENKAYLLFLLFLVSPVDILMSLFTNDIPLVLFGTLGTQFLLYSLKKSQTVKYAILAGLFLGASFLSKYFAIFLLFSLLIFAITTYKIKSIKTLFIASTIILLAVAQNMYFNYNSCWNNIMFNFFARTESHYNFETFSNFLLNLIYVTTPWAFWFLYKSRTNFIKSELFTLVSLILGVMFVVFFIVSLKNLMGIHWFILFLPYIFLLFAFLTDDYLKKLFKYNAIFTFMHIAILMSVLVALHLLPNSVFKASYYYEDAVLSTNMKKTCKVLDEKYADKKLFSTGYTNSAMFNYYCKKDMPMIFSNSVFGRMDDKLVDIRELTDTNFYIFNNREMQEKEFDSVCESVNITTFQVEDANFYVSECKGFNYSKYKKYYLDIQQKKFYDIPSWLPQGKCYFNERYYSNEQNMSAK